MANASLTNSRTADPLLQPFAIRHLKLKNRVFSTSHEPGYSENGMPTGRYQRYHIEKAKGGIAMTMIAGSAVVSADSPQAFGNLLAYKDEIVPHLKTLVDGCHDHDCKVMIQITHLGRRTNWHKADWLPVIAPSAVREEAHRAFPKVMEEWDIERVIQDFVDTAVRMKASGMDGIELMMHGHIVDSFWSPGTNKRDDRWGGSLDNRMRFSLAIIDRVRAAVGSDFIVGARIAGDEDWDLGISRQEGIEICQRVAATGKIDFLNVNRGNIRTEDALAYLIPIMGTKSAPHLEYATAVKAATRFPVLHAGRIADIATARHAIAEGKIDMVAMTRAHIADPHIVNKIKAGEEARIRPCVGATYCLDRLYEGHEALCIHNPATSREATMPHVIAKAKAKRHIVIAGAGPAGLEAARVAAERGHKVTVFEAAKEAGGQVRLIARVKRRAEMIGVIDWRLAECDRLGVEFHYNTLAEAEDLTALRPDVVIVATGGLPQAHPLVEGRDLAVSSWDILSGDVPIAREVLVFDDHGGHPGVLASEMIAASGASLEIASPERGFAPDVGGLTHAGYQRELQKHGVRITLLTRLRKIERAGNKLRATFGTDYASRTDIREVDQIVVDHGTLPVDDLYFALRPRSSNLGEVDYAALIAGKPQQIVRDPNGAFQLFRIGDAVQHKNIHAAIYDALRYLKDI